MAEVAADSVEVLVVAVADSVVVADSVTEAVEVVAVWATTCIVPTGNASSLI